MECGAAVTQPTTGRPRMYCSKRCRQAAFGDAPGASPSWCRSTTVETVATATPAGSGPPGRSGRARDLRGPRHRRRVPPPRPRGPAGPPLALREGRRRHHGSPAHLLRGDRMTTSRQRTRSRRSPSTQLEPDPDNARIHGRDNLKAITASLERFGQLRPADGHGRRRGGGRQRHPRRDEAPRLDGGHGRPPAVDDPRPVPRLRDRRQPHRRARRLGLDHPGRSGRADDRERDPDGRPRVRVPGHAGAGRRRRRRRRAAPGGSRAYRCPACGFRWRFDDGGEVVPL